MHLSLGQKFKLLHIFSHLVAIVGVVWAIESSNYQWLWVSFSIFLYAGIFGVNIALHRYFSHVSFKTSRVVYWILLFSSFIPMLGSPAAWGSIHVYHHQVSDTELDPHSPKNAGLLGSWFTNWPEVVVPLSVYRHFVKDRNIRFLDRYYFHLVVLYVVGLSMISWQLVPFVFAIPAVGCFHGASAIAVIPHLSKFGGYRNYETKDNSHNNVLAWVLSLGEGWHNNHHNNSSRYRHGEKWWEFDPSAFIIKNFLEKKT
jgi:stearoyl-CoA desaturase (delta-9 desaturase)